MTAPEPPFEHILRLTDDIGIFEHAKRAEPRREMGYCLDDVARALVVVSRQPAPSPELAGITAIYLDFVLNAQVPDGRFHNRLGEDRRWEDEPIVEDCWGRALWGLGSAAARSDDPSIRRRAAEGFIRSAGLRSPFPRSMAFAALGAAEVLTATPDEPAARRLLEAVPAVIGRPTDSPAWPWPEPRLAYANAALPEALMAVGEHLGNQQAMDDGLQLLAWLLDLETRNDHLSVTPAGGWATGDYRPGFDQQPIEVAALADACARALRLTGESRWARGLARAVRWFLGDNDAHYSLYEPSTGGGCDGLLRAGRNENQGAESTLAMVATMQHARHLVRQ